MVSPTPIRAAEFKSAYGPKYHFQPNIKGWDKTAIFRLATRSAAYGGALGVAGLLFVSGIPRVRSDVLQHFPIVGRYFVKQELPASDNPF